MKPKKKKIKNKTEYVKSEEISFKGNICDNSVDYNAIRAFSSSLLHVIKRSIPDKKNHLKEVLEIVDRCSSINDKWCSDSWK